MQIGGLRMQNAYFGNTGTQGGTRKTAVNPIRALKEETASSIIRERDTFSLTPAAKDGRFDDILSLQYKKDQIADYANELEDARINDPFKYKQMINQRAADNVNSFNQLVTLVEKGQNTTAYQNVSLEVSGDNKKMIIGGGSSGSTIHVGLSNGWALEFDRDADISGLIDLFSPEDIKRIMEAIVKDNMAQSAQEELDDAKGSVGELLNQDVSGTVVKDKNTQDTKATAGSKEAEKEGAEEASETTSQIIVNADGSRQLVITTKVGDMEMLTKIELSQAKSSDKLKAEQSLFKEEPFDKEPLEDESEMVMNSANRKIEQFEDKIRPIDNQIRNALNAYEANFMYA